MKPSHRKPKGAKSKPRPPPVVRIWLVRHGETEHNKRGIVQGMMDTELNEEGIRQAHAVGERLKDTKFTYALTSDLKRAHLVSCDGTSVRVPPLNILNASDSANHHAASAYHGC